MEEGSGWKIMTMFGKPIKFYKVKIEKKSQLYIFLI